MARDFFYWLGGMLSGGCGDDGPAYQSWIVPGHRSGRLRQDGSVIGGWQLWLPLMQARDKTLEAAATATLDDPPGHVSVNIRAAVYASRGLRCAYPGRLIADLGEATVITPGVADFLLGLPLALPGGHIYWVASWWQYTTPAATITTNATAEAGAYPLLGYSGPNDLTPRVGWAREAAYASIGDEDWPNPPPNDLLTLTIGGQITFPPTTLGLPCVWLRFS